MFPTINASNKGSFVLERFVLKYLNGQTLDLVPFVTQFNIYESIYDPCISALIGVDDSAGIIDTDPVVGSEVEFKYKSFREAPSVTIKFIVDSIEYVTTTGAAQPSQTYTIKMFTPEYKRASAVLVHENYIKQSPENIIAHILKEKIKTNKPFYASKTGSIDSMNCFSLYPFQAIDAIKKRAVSRSYKSSSYMFFENQHGFVFKTLEEILESAKTDQNILSGDMVFYLDGAEPSSVINSSWRRIENIEKVKQGDLTNQIFHGALRAVIYAYNVNTGEHYKLEYDGSENAAKNDFVKISSKDIYRQGDDVGNLIVAPILDTEIELPRIKKENAAKAYAAKLSTNIIRMQIHGDSRLTVGSAAMLNIRKLISATETSTNEISSGVYIFTKIRHVFLPAAAAVSGSYIQYCEMMNTGVL